jgi:superfamily I DNA/RNA helicase
MSAEKSLYQLRRASLEVVGDWHRHKHDKRRRTMPAVINSDYLDIEVCGILVPRMKVMDAQYKGRCCRTGKWYDPEKDGPCKIAFKHRDQLTDDQKRAIFGEKTVYHVTVLLEGAGVTYTPGQAPQQPVAARPAPSHVRTPQVLQKKKHWNPSKYQSKIMENLLDTECHLFIEALAGCGKTETLVWLVREQQLALRGKNVIYLAFNKSIQEELVKKLQGTGCIALTTHAFGFQMLKRTFKELEKAGKGAIYSGKSRDLFAQMLSFDLFGEVSDASLKKVKKSDHYKCKSAVVNSGGLVGFIKNWAILPTLTEDGYFFADDQREQIKGFLDTYQINVPEGFTDDQVVDYACRVVIASIPAEGEPLTRITFDDMLYLPLVLGLEFPKYDLILTDESQDFNEAQEQFLFLMAEKGARCVVVGDENQCVYAFRGSDTQAFHRIRHCLETTERGVISCDLPINYRSDEVIINHARQWVPKLEGRGFALGQQKGELSHDTTYSQALQMVNNDGDEEFAFLCRINVPLVVTAYQLIAQGKRVCIIGRQAIASPMLSIIEDLCGFPDKYGHVPEYYTDRITDRKDDAGTVVEEGLLTRLANYYRLQSLKLTQEGHEQALEDLQNNVDCIEIIAGRVKDDSIQAVIKEIDSLFVEKPDDKGTIKLSTVHRAKGLEWDTVLILCPHLMPHPNAKPNPDGSWSEEQQQEQNLQYVAATRAKHRLHYICNWPFGRGKGNRLTSSTPERVLEMGEGSGRKVRCKVVEKGPATPAPVKSVVFVDDGEPF